MDCLCRNDVPGDRARRSLQLWVAVCLLGLALSAVDLRLLAASEHHGQVMFGGLPVPGVTVTASQGGKHFVAITNQEGVYTFAGLDDGVWKFQVEMLGFAPQTQDISIAADTPSPVWDLKLLPIEEITRGIPPVNSESTQVTSPPPSEGNKAPPAVASPAPKSPSGFQRTAVNAASNAPPATGHRYRAPCERYFQRPHAERGDGPSRERQREQWRRVDIRANGRVRQ